MISKCANSLCANPFRTLRKGRLVVFHVRQRTIAEAEAREFQPFWLCEECSGRFTLLLTPGREYVCVPKPLVSDLEERDLLAAQDN